MRWYEVKRIPFGWVANIYTGNERVSVMFLTEQSADTWARKKFYGGAHAEVLD